MLPARLAENQGFVAIQNGILFTEQGYLFHKIVSFFCCFRYTAFVYSSWNR